MLSVHNLADTPEASLSITMFQFTRDLDESSNRRVEKVGN